MRIMTVVTKIIMPDGGDDEQAKTVLADMVEEALKWEADTPFVILTSEPKFEEKADPCETGLRQTSGTLEDPAEEYYNVPENKMWKWRVMETEAIT